jgi:hypothetical protein
MDRLSRLLALGVAIGCFAVCGSVTGQQTDRYVRVVAKDLPHGATLSARNTSIPPVTLTLKVEMENMQSNAPLPLTLTFKSRASVRSRGPIQAAASYWNSYKLVLRGVSVAVPLADQFADAGSLETLRGKRG